MATMGTRDLGWRTMTDNRTKPDVVDKEAILFQCFTVGEIICQMALLIVELREGEGGRETKFLQKLLLII